MKFDPEMQVAKKQLETMGYEVEKPQSQEAGVYDGDPSKDATLKRGFIDEHFRKIGESDAILVANYTKNDIENYVGGNTLVEIANAYVQGLDIFLLNPIPDISYGDEIRGMDPIILDGDISKIDAHFKSLPLVMMSTASPVKRRAVSRGLRRAGIRTRVDGVKVASGVNEQPMSIDESYQGATNRHENLKQEDIQDATYLVTIESGLHAAHRDHNVFDCAVIILERVEGERKVGIDLGLEFPREMTDKVPSQYPDLGVLVQQEYGSILKDPIPFFTGGKLTRAKVLENAVYNIAVQLTEK